MNRNSTPPFLLPMTNPLCMVVCQPPLVGLGEHYFLIKYGGKVSASLRCSWVLYSTNWANYATLPQARTQQTQQHTQHQHERHLPTHQQLWPSPSISRLAAPRTNSATTPYGPMQGTRHQVRRCHCWYPCLGCRNATHRKIEREVGPWP